MSKFEFSINLSASPNQLIKIATDYENLSNYLPQQLNSIEVVERNNNETITEEVITFSIFKQKINQKTLHKNMLYNKLYSEIISGPAKGTIFNVLYEKIDSGTKVSVDIDLKLGLKVKLLQRLIKKYYKLYLTGVLYKMNTAALELHEN